MGLFIQQKSDRTELQKRVAEELNEKAKLRAKLEEQDLPDGVTDSAYMKNTKQTTSLAWVWIVIVILALITMGVVIWSLGRP